MPGLFREPRFIGAFFIIAAFGVPSLALASYTFTPVVVPGSSFNQCFTGLNDNGQIIVSTNLGSYLYQDGTYTQLPPPPEPYPVNGVIGAGINNAGTVVGSVFADPAAGTPEEGFTLNGSTYTIFSRPGWANTQPRGIGPSGLITGDSYDPATGQSAGFLYDPMTDDFTDVTPEGSFNTIVQGINAAGQIVGSARPIAGPVYGFIYQDEMFSTFEILDGRTRPRGINDSGLISGYTHSKSAGTEVGFVGTLEAYELLVVPDGEVFGTYCSAINNADEVLCGTFDDKVLSYCYFGSPVR